MAACKFCDAQEFVLENEYWYATIPKERVLGTSTHFELYTKDHYGSVHEGEEFELYGSLKEMLT